MLPACYASYVIGFMAWIERSSQPSQLSNAQSDYPRDKVTRFENSFEFPMATIQLCQARKTVGPQKLTKLSKDKKRLCVVVTVDFLARWYSEV